MVNHPKRSKPRVVLTLKAGEDTFHVHALNAGETLPNFYPGGQSLTVGNTASLVVLREGPTSGTQNIEYGLRNRDFWDWIVRLINGVDGVTATGSKD